MKSHRFICFLVATRLMPPASSATKSYLRIENPGYTISEVNFITDSVIGNMKCKGKFWL